MATGGVDPNQSKSKSLERQNITKALLHHAQNALNQSPDWSAINGCLYQFLTEKINMDKEIALEGLAGLLTKRILNEIRKTRLEFDGALKEMLSIEERKFGDRGKEMTAGAEKLRLDYENGTYIVIQLCSSMAEKNRSFRRQRPFNELSAIWQTAQILDIYRDAILYLQRTDVQIMDHFIRNIQLIKEVIFIRKRLRDVPNVELYLIQDLSGNMESELLSHLICDTTMSPGNFELIKKYVSFQWSNPSLQYLQLTETAPLSDDKKSYQYHFSIVHHVLPYVCATNPDQKQNWLNYIKLQLKAMFIKSGQTTAHDRETTVWLLYQVSYLSCDTSFPDECLRMYNEEDEFVKYVQLLGKMVETLVTDHDEIPPVILEMRANGYQDLRIIDDKIPDLDVLLQPWWTTTNSGSWTATDTLLNYSSASSTQESTQYSKTCPKPSIEPDAITTVEYNRMVPRLDQTLPKGLLHQDEFASLPFSDIIQPRPERDILYTDLRRDTKYHGRCYGFDPLSCQWWFVNVMVEIQDLKNVDEDKKGASRDLINLFVSTEESAGFEFVMKIERDEFQHTWENSRRYCIHQSVARHYVDLFSYALHQSKIESFIFLAMLEVNFLVLFQDSRSGKVIEFGSLERNFSPTTDYIKFSSNTYFVNEKLLKGTEVLDVLMAFSHYTYEKSGGTLLISDLQGALIPTGYTEDSDYSKMMRNVDKGLMVALTDPVIHTTLEAFDHPGCGNWGVDGFRLFFTQQHTTCNKYCSGLGLTRPEGMSSQQ